MDEQRVKREFESFVDSLDELHEELNDGDVSSHVPPAVTDISDALLFDSFSVARIDPDSVPNELKYALGQAIATAFTLGNHMADKKNVTIKDLESCDCFEIAEEELYNFLKNPGV